MKTVLIGTAGHIDHGKTALIQALTGMDTDRLAEEKSRGITVDLGFAHMELPNGTANFIDVPGHEKFIKNMLSGAGRLDLILMTVAADEGVMPQTREHLAILELLGSANGFIVITKCDLADADTLELAKDDVRESFAGTFLEDVPVFEVSCKTGEGIDRLRDAIAHFYQTFPKHSCQRPFRMAVDRVFTMDGFGTIATGTVMDGCAGENEEIEIDPRGITARIRTIQSCGKQVKTICAGQRGALNLARVKPDELHRGDLLTAPGSQLAVTRLEVKLTLMKGASMTVQNGTRLHLHLGTACVLCRVSLAQADALNAGETAYAQLRLETPVCAYAGDRFVVRFYSPLETIGGGVILDARPRRRKRLDRCAVERLKLYDTGSLSEQICYECSCGALRRDSLAALFAHVEPQRLQQTVNELCRARKLIAAGDLLTTPKHLNQYQQQLNDLLRAYHEAHLLEWGMPLAQLKTNLPSALVDYFQTIGAIQCRHTCAANFGFTPRKTSLYQSIAEKIQRLYEAWAMMPEDVSRVSAKIGVSQADTMRTMELLAQDGLLIALNSSLFVSKSTWQKAKETAQKLIASGGTVTLAQYRDALGISRKYAMALLEHMDACEFTLKDGEARTLRHHVESKTCK